MRSNARSQSSTLREAAEKNPLLAVAAAAVAVAPTVWLGVKLFRAAVGGRAPVVLDTATAESWTTDQVVKWLVANKFSPQCIESFRTNEIDGSVLFNLEAYHLTDMGVKKLKDRILFEKCVDVIRPAHLKRRDADDAGGDDTDDTSSEEERRRTVGVAAQPAAPKPPIANAVHRTATADDRRQTIHAIVMKLQSIYERCSSEEFMRSAPQTQLSVVRAAKSELAIILNVIQNFPPEEVETVLPLTTQLSKMLEEVESAFVSSEATEDAAGAERGAQQQASDALAKLHQMLDGFLVALNSPEAAEMSTTDRERLATNIAGQVSRIFEVSSALPADERSALKTKCERIVAAARALMAGRSAPPATSLSHEGAEAPKAASIQFLIRRVRAVFETLKSDTLLKLTPQERREVIAKMNQEMQSVQTEAAHLPETEQAVMRQVFVNVQQVVDQLNQLTQQETEMQSLRDQQQSLAKPKPSADTNPLPAISSSIKEILDLLRDPQFMESPPEVRAKMCHSMNARIQAIASEVSEMPNAIQEAILPMLTKVSELVAAVLRSSKPVSPAADTKTPQEPADTSVSRVVGQLKEALGILKSREFLSASPQEQLRVCATLRPQLQSVASRAESFPPSVQQAIVPMLSKMLDMVAEVERSHSAAQTTDASSQSSDDSKAAFVAVVERLKEVYELIDSDSFKNAPPAAKAETAKQLLTHMSSISQLAQGLAPEHVASVNELITPLLSTLKHFSSLAQGAQTAASQKTAAPGAAAAQKKASQPAPAAGPTEAFQTIVDSLQQVFSVVNSERFKSAPATAQAQVASKLKEHVDQMLPHFEDLDTEERSVAKKFAEPLVQLLNAVISHPTAKAAAPQKQSAPTQVDDDDEAAPDSNPALSSVVTKLKALFEVVQSDRFQNAPRPQREHMSAVLWQEVESLKEEVRGLEAHHAEQIMPTVVALGSLLEQEMNPVEEIPDDEDAEREEPFSESEADERLNNFRKALEGVQLMRSRTLSFEELQQQLLLLDEIDAMGIATRQEMEIREAFQKELESAIKKVKRHHGIPEDDEAEEEEQQQEETRASEERAENSQQTATSPGNAKRHHHRAGRHHKKHPSAPAAEKKATEAAAGDDAKSSDGVAQVVQAFQAIRRALQGAKLTSVSQLVPITSMIEETLQVADNSGIPWRKDAAAVQLISSTLGLVQQIQERIDTAPHESSDVEKILHQALQQLQQNPPVAAEDLAEYIEVLDQIHELQDQLTREDLMAYQDLQKAVLSHHKRLTAAQQLSRAQTSDTQSPSQRDGSGLTSPQFSTRVPPNTPAVKADAADQPPALVRDEEEEGEALQPEDTEEGDADDAEEEGLSEDQELLARMLMQIIEKLQRQRFKTEELSAFDNILVRLRSQPLAPQVKQILEVVEELLEVHRGQNDVDEMQRLKAEKTQAQRELAAEKQRSPKADSKSQSKTEVQAPAEEPVPTEEEGIPDGLSNELGLLPRILERLVMPDFVENTTLFEIECISKILRQLSASSDVRSNESLTDAVQRAEVLFSKHMQKYSPAATKEASSVMCPTVLTGMELETDPSGQKLIQFTIIGSEEQEEYTVNVDFLAKMHGGTPTPVELPSAEVHAQWEGGSRAIIFCVQQYPEGNENTTALSELMMLHQTLDEKHDFDILSVVDDKLTLEEAKQIILDVLAEKPQRLLLYYHTPVPPCIAPAQHGITFFDNTVLFHKEVLSLCKGVDHVTIVHDSTKSLEVVASVQGVVSPYVGVSLTEGAALIANTSRCWLFDGLFTPIVVELLSKDEVRPVCAEDIVTFAVSSLTSNMLTTGVSYTKDPVLGQCFWVTRSAIE